MILSLQPVSFRHKSFGPSPKVELLRQSIYTNIILSIVFFRLLLDSIMDEVGNNSLQTNIIKRENVTATYDCHTYQLTPDSPIPISQTHIQAQVQNQGGTIVSHPIPTDYSSEYWVKDTPVQQKLLISSEFVHTVGYGNINRNGILRTVVCAWLILSF